MNTRREATDANNGTTRVGVVAVSYRSDEVLPTFLSSVSGSASLQVETIVVDNAPDAAGVTAELVRSLGARYLAEPSNRGYGSAINAGVRSLDSSVDWLLVCNPDIELDPTAIARLLEAGSRDPSIGALGPAILEPSGLVYPSARAIPGIRLGIGHALFARLWPSNPWTRRYYASTEPVSREAEWLSGACLLIRATAFERIGGFDEAFFMYFEDVDLGMRMRAAGYRNVYEPAAVVTHVGGHSTRSNRAVSLAAHHASARLFVARKYPGPWCAPVRAVMTIGLQVRLRLALLTQ